MVGDGVLCSMGVWRRVGCGWSRLASGLSHALKPLWPSLVSSLFYVRVCLPLGGEYVLGVETIDEPPKAKPKIVASRPRAGLPQCTEARGRKISLLSVDSVHSNDDLFLKRNNSWLQGASVQSHARTRCTIT